jgi:hypothetical protein
MARLVLAVEAARAKVVIVGDDRQLSAVGPGGALHQVLADHPDVVTVLTENLRQRDPTERDALLDLRSGNLDRAIDWYAHNQRITVSATPVDALVAMVDAWAADTEAGHDTFLLAWRRANVADLNRLARDRARQHGWLVGPDMETPHGRLFAVGDTVVLLAPNYRGELVTSERARVTAIHPNARALTIETDDRRQVTLLGSELDPDRIDYGYALTVHREQGATSDRTHYYTDSGGRELAYVAMSRARHRSTVHTTADDLDQAAERLRDDWSRQQHDTWLTPVTSVGDDPNTQPTPTHREATRARLQTELEQLKALEPPDVTTDLAVTLAQLKVLRRDREHLIAGTGRYQSTPTGRVARQLHDLDNDLKHARAQLDNARPWDRARWKRIIATYQNHRTATLDEWDQHIEPEARRLDTAITTTETRAADLEHDSDFNNHWHRDHPEHARRVRQLEQALAFGKAHDRLLHALDLPESGVHNGAGGLGL